MRAGVLSLRARRSDSAFPAAPRAASFLPVLKGKRGGMVAKKNAKTGTDRDGAAAAAEHGGDGAEVAEDHVQVVERGRDRRGQGVRDGVHPGYRVPAGSPAAEGVAGGGHLRGGDR